MICTATQCDPRPQEHHKKQEMAIGATERICIAVVWGAGKVFLDQIC